MNGREVTCSLLFENKGLNVNSHLLSPCSALILKSTRIILKFPKIGMIPNPSVFPPHMSLQEIPGSLILRTLSLLWQSPRKSAGHGQGSIHSQNKKLRAQHLSTPRRPALISTVSGTCFCACSQPRIWSSPTGGLAPGARALRSSSVRAGSCDCPPPRCAQFLKAFTCLIPCDP